MFRKCASFTLGVPDLVLPIMCYRAFPQAPQVSHLVYSLLISWLFNFIQQLTECLDNAERDEGFDQKVKQKFSAEYQVFPLISG